MDTSAWLAVTRDDGETVGCLEPVTPDYDVVQPCSVLGHIVGEPSDYAAGEDLLCERGISGLMQLWLLKDAPDALPGSPAILEVSSHGIVVAEAPLVKTLAPSERATVGWPDVVHRLEPAASVT